MVLSVYLAGPMTGYEDHNYPAFRRAADALRSMGYAVVNPAELHSTVEEFPGSLSWEHYLREDVAHLLKCDAVAVLPGWRESPGASFEVEVAERVSIPVYTFCSERGLVPLEEHLLVGLHGHARSGKDVAASYLVHQHGFTRVAFADPLKELARKGARWNGMKNAVGRELLQDLGLAAREIIGETVWLDLGMKRAEEVEGPVVITDVRFPNEAQAVKDAGGVVIEIVRPGVGPANGHVSEVELPPMLIDATVANRNTPEQLGYNVAREVGLA